MHGECKSGEKHMASQAQYGFDVPGCVTDAVKEYGKTMHAQERNSEEIARAEIAAKVHKVWARALERELVADDSDFYFFGGNHFLAPVMMRNLSEEIGMELTVRDLEQARTIAKMTDLIYFERTRIDRSTVVPLRNTNGTKPPLFIVHGVGGNVLGFYSLAKCLEDDQPVYGIQAQALLPDREAKLRLEDMAAQYVADMKEIRPHGPYHLLGFSFGGLVAYEIAQQLTAAGEEVGMVGMLDTRQPHLLRGVPGRGSIYKQVFFRLKIAYLRTKRRKGRLKYLWQRVNARLQRRNYMHAAAKGDGQVASAVRDVREINFAAGVAYVVKPYAGSVTLFKAEPDIHEAELPEDLDWKRFVQGELEIKHLPGDHGRILFEPGLSAMAKELTAGFKKVDAEREAVQANGAKQARVEMEF